MRCGEQAEGQGRRSLNLDAAIEPREPDQLPWAQERSGRAGQSLSPGPAVPTDSAQPRGLRSRGRGGRPSRGLAAPWPGLALLPPLLTRALPASFPASSLASSWNLLLPLLLPLTAPRSRCLEGFSSSVPLSAGTNRAGEHSSPSPFPLFLQPPLCLFVAFYTLLVS